MANDKTDKKESAGWTALEFAIRKLKHVQPDCVTVDREKLVLCVRNPSSNKFEIVPHQCSSVLISEVNALPEFTVKFAAGDGVIGLDFTLLDS